MPHNDETPGIDDAKNKIESLPQRYFHSSMVDGHLINHTKQPKCDTVE